MVLNGREMAENISSHTLMERGREREKLKVCFTECTNRQIAACSAQSNAIACRFPFIVRLPICNNRLCFQVIQIYKLRVIISDFDKT